jgi:1-acyl-sn-glycerol-3-phosphate acyltransferase
MSFGGRSTPDAGLQAYQGCGRAVVSGDIKDDVAAALDSAVDQPLPLGIVDAELVRKVLVPYKLIRSYCRVTVEGLENVPDGPALLACNHTGWLGLDYANLATTLHDHLGRIVRGVVHPAWFANRTIGAFATRLGLVEASKDAIVSLLGTGKLVVVFPEAEHGAFKDVRESKYKLLEFKRGFVRAAMRAHAPIVPVAIVGGEEANPSLGTLTLTDKLFRIPLPIPRNILPRPVKWRISFLPPLSMAEYAAEDAANTKLVHDLSEDIRQRIQKEVQVQIERRGNAYW